MLTCAQMSLGTHKGSYPTSRDLILQAEILSYKQSTQKKERGKKEEKKKAIRQKAHFLCYLFQHMKLLMFFCVLTTVNAFPFNQKRSPDD